MNKKSIQVSSLIMLLTIIGLSSCNKEIQREPAEYINTFIGTGGHGHTFPGATVPFGMVQLSPDTRKDSWDGCSGYHYSDDFILGFSHQHLSGTGVGDYGDIRFIPMVGDLFISPGNPEIPKSGYGSKFSHENETSKAGYYNVKLDNGINVELTSTQRAGMHRYTFPNAEKSRLVVDLIESVVSETIIDAEISFISDHELIGYRRSKSWANDQVVYFYADFSMPFESYGIWVNGDLIQNANKAKSDSLIADITFDTSDGSSLVVKVGISAVDYEGAKENCKKEISNFDFDLIARKAFEIWNEKMNKIEVSGGTLDEKSIFYTALYHTMIAPNMYSDINNKYRGHDGKIYEDESFQMHTVFSLWDTFRTLHPLFTIIEQEKTNHLIKSMLDMYKHDKLLPVWELAGCETNCMIGYNSIPVITDAWVKNIRGYDAKLALKAMVNTANADQFGLEYYKAKGYIPADKEGESVSRTLEYAYDDWCIAKLAEGLGDTINHKIFIERAQYYKNIFDEQTGFFRGRSNGCFTTPFDPTQVNFMLTEANTWQYNFFVPQDINTHIDLVGGYDEYETMLDTLFNTNMKVSGRHQSDITGLIGQYAHGNEPSHHMAYLYNYVGSPWKTQEIVENICANLYSNAPDGLSGNEDCGQMSAWYVMSAMGFYPVTPGSDIYVLGTPVFDETSIKLENGNTFVIKANRKTQNSFYVNSVNLNGKPLLNSYISHGDIMKGGELLFELSETPNKVFGNDKKHRPFQKITDNLITPVPYFEAPTKTFTDSILVGVSDIINGSKIYVTPNKINTFYERPIILNSTSTLIAFSENNGVKSFPEEATFIKIPDGRSVDIITEYSNQYTAGGDIALINTIRGGDNYKTGNWQGYYGQDMEVVLDLGKVTKISEVGAGFLQDENSWIFMPSSITFEGSVDGLNYTEIGKIQNNIDPTESGGITKNYELATSTNIKYLKIYAKSLKICPSWHKGYPNPCWIFVDEIWAR